MAKAKELELAPGPDGGVLIRFTAENGKPLDVSLSPTLVGQLLVTLLHGISHSQEPELRKLAQFLTIREVSAHVEYGLATLSYELECGLQLTSTLEADSCMALSAELSKATKSPKRH